MGCGGSKDGGGGGQAAPKPAAKSNAKSNAKAAGKGGSSFPDLSKHNNWMAKCLTPEVYELIKDRKTAATLTLDDILQTGVDNPGHPFIYTVGAVAGDEESYETFRELLDPIIDGRHNGYPKHAIHRTDLDSSKITDGVLDANYVLSCRVRTGRSIRGLRLPPTTDRAERREVERVLTTALSKLDGPLSGSYVFPSFFFQIKLLRSSEEATLKI